MNDLNQVPTMKSRMQLLWEADDAKRETQAIKVDIENAKKDLVFEKKKNRSVVALLLAIIAVLMGVLLYVTYQQSF